MTYPCLSSFSVERWIITLLFIILTSMVVFTWTSGDQGICGHSPLDLISRAANKTLKYIHLIAALDFKSKGWVTTNSLVTRWPGERDLWIQCEVGVGQLNIDDQFHFLKHHPELYFRLKFYYYYSLSNRLHRFSVILYAGEATITFIFFTFLSSLCITVHSSSENQS